MSADPAATAAPSTAQSLNEEKMATNNTTPSGKMTSEEMVHSEKQDPESSPASTLHEGVEHNHHEQHQHQHTAAPAALVAAELGNTPEGGLGYAVATEKGVEGPEDADHEYLHGSQLAFVVFALCLVVFCVALDNTIIATAIPKITDAFNALDDVGWYSSAYLLCSSAFQLLYGKFYARFNKKVVFLTGLAFFELGSLVCATAPSSVALIVGRAIAGLGAAGLFSGAMIIIAHSVELAKRPLYTGLIGGMFGIASVVGPLLGGAFTDAEHATWRWCFYINLPIGGITAVILIIWLKMPSTAVSEKNLWETFLAFDPIGTISFVPGIICLLLALQWGGTKYAWSDGRIIALFVVFAILILVFIGMQVYLSRVNESRATVPVRIATQRSILGGAMFGLCLTAAFMSFIYFLPIWFQAVKGTSAVQSGIDSLPLILAQTVGSILAGVLITKLGYYVPFMYLSPVLGAIGAGLITTFQIDTATRNWLGYQIIFGLGCGMGFQQPSLAAQTVLNLSDVSIGVSFVFFIQFLGGALFTSVSENVFTNRLVSNIIASGLDVNPEAIVSTGATVLANSLPAADLQTILVAYNDALDKTYQVSLIMVCLSVLFVPLVEWRSVKGKKMEMAAA